MISQPLWLRDLVAYSIQAAALVGVGAIMASLLRLRVPRVRLAYWQALLAGCVFLPLLQPWRPEVLETSGSVISNVSFAASTGPAAPSGPSLAEIILLLICTGIILRALWMSLGLGRLWLYRRRAQRIEHVPEAIEGAQHLSPVSPRFFISRQISTPATYGVLRPVIILPIRFLEMKPAMQKAIALHELLHVERRDWMWNMFEEAVLTLLWFHLPLWWVVHSARLSREQVVDAEAVRRSNARRPYLKALLEMAGQKRLAESLPAPLFLRESDLAERIALMMKEVQMTRKQITVSILTAAGVLLIAGASVVWAFPLKTSAQQAESSSVSSAQASLAGPIEQNGKTKDAASQGSKSRVDPSVERKQGKPEEPKDNGLPQEINQAEIQRRVEEAMKQLKAAQMAAPKIDEAKIRKQVEQAMKQAKIAQDAVPKIDQAKIQQQVEEAMKHLQKLNTPEMQQRLQEQMKDLGKMNTPELRQKIQDALKRLEKLNTPEIRQSLDRAMKQAQIAQAEAAKMNQAEMQRQLKQTQDELQATRKQLEAARKQLRKQRLELEKQQKRAKPMLTSPAQSPKAAPVPPPPPRPPQNQ